MHPMVADKEITISNKKKCNVTAVSKFLDQELHELYQRVVQQNTHFNQVPIPHHTHTTSTQAVGSYTVVLQGLSNTQ
eukprot:11434946-Ditylum_brightwellii.AAC.1